MGLLSRRHNIASVHVTFSDGSEMIYVRKEEDITSLTETIDYGRLGDKPKRIWNLHWIEKED